MTILGMCRPFRDPWDRVSERCFRCFPCLSDPARRSSLGLKVALVILHLIYVGVLFLFDSDLIEKTKKEPWYTAIYLLLFVATVAQYFFTSGSSPGYVLDAMRAANETDAIFRKTSTTSNKDNLLQAKMEAMSLLWMEVSQEKILWEVMQLLGQSW